MSHPSELQQAIIQKENRAPIDGQLHMPVGKVVIIHFSAAVSLKRLYGSTAGTSGIAGGTHEEPARL
jgi:hypothetical protein